MSIAYPDFTSGDDSYGRLLSGWLRQKTSLTEAQICAWTGLTPKAFAEVVSGRKQQLTLSPINQRLLTWPEIRRCEEWPEARLEKRAAIFKMPQLAIRSPPEGLRSAKFHTARLVELYFLGNTRNAWHSTRINQYSPGAISARQSTASERGEKLRTQGSKFYIERIPGFALQSEGLTLVAAEANRSLEHRRLGEVFDGPLTAGRILDAYATARENTVLWLHAEGNWRFDPWTRNSPARWVSSPGQYWLTWNRYSGSTAVTDELRDVLRRARRSIRLNP